MSNEDRLKWLKEIEKDIFVCSLESTFVEDAKSCAIHSAIEELEKQKTLQKEYDGEARADGCDDKISRKKLLMHLNDYALAEAPDERTPDVAKEYTAKDMQMMVYRTIRDCMRAVEDVKGE